MLSITKLGIQVLSRFAKQHYCKPYYNGYYVPDREQHNGQLILAEGDICSACCNAMKYSIYGWSWQEGLRQANFSTTDTLIEVLFDLLLQMPNLSHVAIKLEHENNIDNRNLQLWIYRFDKGKLH